MENEFYSPAWNSTNCDLNSYFTNTCSSNWDSSFHSTLTSVHPLPPPQQAPLISGDPSFAARDARFSMFGSRSFNGRSSVVDKGEFLEFPPGVSSCQSLKGFPAGSDKEGIQIPVEMKMNRFSPGNGEESSVSEPPKSTSRNDLNPRKRKSNPRGKNEIKINQIQQDADAKRTESEDTNGTEKSGKVGNGKASGKSKDDSRNNEEPQKDYIHVRARRGQATDSHSLAERVRREKISQRMKFLQDLVPGCNKVTGKALMLDEITNYVQSLQRQVEFLSMKLSTVNPRTDINIETLLSKDPHQARSLLSQSMFPLESSPVSPAFSYGYPSEGSLVKKNAHSDESETSFSMSPSNTQRPNHNHMVQLPPSMDVIDQSASMVSMWIDELHNVVQMNDGQNELQNFRAIIPTSQLVPPKLTREALFKCTHNSNAARQVENHPSDIFSFPYI